MEQPNIDRSVTPANNPPAFQGSAVSYHDFLNANFKTGQLKIQASAAQQSIPIQDVAIQVLQVFDATSVLFFEGKTNPDGIIESILLPAPPASDSLTPYTDGSGAVYQVYATHPAFAPVRHEVEIYEGITTILPLTFSSRVR